MRLNPKLFYTLLFCYFLFTCEIPFENDARVLVKARIIDGNNLPIENAAISVFARRDNGFLYSDGPSGESSYLLGKNYSDSEGYVSIVTLFARDEDFVVEVFVEPNYSKYLYRTNTDTYIPNDYTIDVGQVSIFKLADFTLNIEKLSSENATLNYSLSYQSTFCKETFVNGSINESESFCYPLNTINRILSDNNPNDNLPIRTLKGTDVIFTYSVNGEPEQSQTITINQTINEFNFSY